MAAAAGTDAARWRAGLRAAAVRHAAPLVLLAALVAWLALKAAALGHRFSDGHVYTYMGYLVAGGELPYRDFYYSSPPLLPYLLAVIGTLAGWTSRVPDAVPMALAAVDALLVYLLVTRLGGAGDGHGPGRDRRSAVGITAVASATMLLFSYAGLATTDFASDVHWITTLTLAAMLAATHARWAVAGVLLSLALLTKLYAAMIVVGFVGALLLARRFGPALRVGAWTALPFLAVMAIMTAVVGKPVIEQVLLNNLGRPAGIDNAAILAFFAGHDLWIYPAAALLAIAVLRAPALRPCVFPVVLYAAFMAGYPDVYYLYLKPLVAYAAVAVGAASLRAWGADLRIALLWAAATAVTGSLAVAAWQDEQRDTSKIDDLDGMVATVRTLTSPGEAIYGDSTLTPLVALEADRPIFRNHVDTNDKFVTQGLVDLEQRAAEIAAGEVKAVLVRGLVDGDRLVALFPTLPADFLSERCRVVRTFPIRRDYSANAVIIWRCDR